MFFIIWKLDGRFDLIRVVDDILFLNLYALVPAPVIIVVPISAGSFVAFCKTD